MIVYTPLWETLKKKGLSTYTLRVKFQISGSTVQRLRKNMSVSTNTLDDLCNLLDCSLSEIAEHVPNEEQCSPRARAFRSARRTAAILPQSYRQCPVLYINRNAEARSR